MEAVNWLLLFLPLIPSICFCLPTGSNETLPAVSNQTAPTITIETLPTFSATVTSGEKEVYWPTSFLNYGHFETKSSGQHLIQFELPSEARRTEYTVLWDFYFDSLALKKPSIQLIVCNQLIANRLENDCHWHTRDGESCHYEFKFQASECEGEGNKNIAYNITLHHEDDIFGWNYMLVYPSLYEISLLTPYQTRDISLIWFYKYLTYESYLCNVYSCDTSLFSFSNFERVLGGGGELGPMKKQRYFVDNNINSTLRLNLESTNYDASKYDACFAFINILSPSTRIKLLAEDENGYTRYLRTFNTLLEETESRWYNSEYCLSDYSPPIVGLQNYNIIFLAESTAENQERISVILGTKNITRLTKPIPPVDYLPDASTLDNRVAFNKYWVIRSDSKLKFSSKNAETNRWLIISQINPTSFNQFVMKSRWIDASYWNMSQIGAELRFYYQTEPAYWVENVNFELQYSINGSMRSISFGEQAKDNLGRIDIEHNLADTKMDALRIIIHHQISSVHGNHDLVIQKLAFGDICTTNQKQCSSGGKCEPTGFMKAKCICREGYYGDMCEKWSPCYQIDNDGSSGQELCKQLDATCDIDSHVLRCLMSDGEIIDPLSSEKLEQRHQQQTSRTNHESRAGSIEKEEEGVMKSMVVPLMILLVIIVLAVKWKKRSSQPRSVSTDPLDPNRSLWL